jgi:hypothetical protein
MIVEKQQKSIDQLKLDKCSNVELHSYENLPTKIDCDEINRVDAPKERSKRDGRKNESSDQSDNTICHISSPAKRTRGD